MDVMSYGNREVARILEEIGEITEDTVINFLSEAETSSDGDV